MYTNVCNIDYEVGAKNQSSWSGLLNHTALSGHAILVGESQQMYRITPVLRNARMMVSSLNGFSDLDPCMLVGHKTMFVVEANDDEHRRLFSKLSRTYPNILCVALVSDSEHAYGLSENSSAIGGQSEGVEAEILAAWESWGAHAEGLLEVWLESLELLVP